MWLYGVSIRMLRCGVGARSLAGCTVAKCLHEARARGSRVLFVLVVSIAMFRLRISFMRLADEEKKEEALNRVLLFRWTVAESPQSTCPDVGRREHHWRYRRKTRRHRPR